MGNDDYYLFPFLTQHGKENTATATIGWLLTTYIAKQVGRSLADFLPLFSRIRNGM